jgi:hypothetical protein
MNELHQHHKDCEWPNDNDVAEDDSGTSMPKTLARLFQKSLSCRNTCNESKISCWYYYEKAYEERVENAIILVIIPAKYCAHGDVS